MSRGVLATVVIRFFEAQEGFVCELNNRNALLLRKASRILQLLIEIVSSRAQLLCLGNSHA